MQIERRNISSVSSAVSKFFAQDKDQVHQEVIPGKDTIGQNTTETSRVKPEVG